MRQKRKLVLGSFCVTVLLIIGLFGFITVDLRADRYMPGRFAPMLQLSEVSEEGVRFSFMGTNYLIDAQPFSQAQETLQDYRGLLPTHPRFVHAVTLYLDEVWSEAKQKALYNE